MSRAEHKAQDLPHLDYPWRCQCGVRKPRALCPAAWVALVHVLPVPPQSHWLNSSAVTPPAHSWDFWRGVWRCLAQSQGVESTGIIGKEKPDPPQAAAKETSSVLTLSPSICTPNHVISTVPSSPRAPWWVGRPRSSPPLLQHRGGGAEGRVHHPHPFCWAGRTSWPLWHLVLPVGPPAAAGATPL